ncbi:MAG: hypothetical protein R2710_25600 [Acidimicrobiales bacterium]
MFTSDHGDMMGDHGLMLKGYMPYRGTLRCRWSSSTPTGRRPAPHRSPAAASTLGSTLLDLAGLEAASGSRARAWCPILDDRRQRFEIHILIEDDLAGGLAALAPIPARVRTLVTTLL